MPYRIDIQNASDDALDRLVELGAIDVELSDGGIAALMPDNIAPEKLASAFGIDNLSVSPAVGRDAGSVWVLTPPPIRIGRLRIVQADIDTDPGALRMIDGAAFGTGLHATTALCLEALDELVQTTAPDAVLDVGTGSGVLALGALMMGVRRAVGIDIDEEALQVAAENARINAMEGRLQLTRGGPDAVTGSWPLVLANILAAPLVEMAPVLVRRLGHLGLLVLSGIPASVAQDVETAYRRQGMQRVHVKSKAGWVALVLRASW